MNLPFRYVLTLQYLGFRYHGWAKQSGLKTIHSMLDKSLKFTLVNSDFRTVGSSRTDSMVSALDSHVLLLTAEAVPENFENLLNHNLPPDIRLINIRHEEHALDIRNTISKTYHYVFAFGHKPHPFAAALLTTIPEELDIQKMQAGAKLFEGHHHFSSFCTQPKEETEVYRTITKSTIEKNEVYQANFFPQDSWIYSVSSPGFMRNQVRLMMGQLIEIGRGNLTLEKLTQLLSQEKSVILKQIAPPSGLILFKSELNR